MKPARKGNHARGEHGYEEIAQLKADGEDKNKTGEKEKRRYRQVGVGRQDGYISGTARLLSGDEDEATIEHARVLLDKAGER